MCQICEFTKKSQEEVVRATRLGEKLTLARLNFTDAAEDDNAEKMQVHREEIHTIVDCLLDATWSASKAKNDLKDAILQGLDNGGFKPH